MKKVVVLFTSIVGGLVFAGVGLAWSPPNVNASCPQQDVGFRSTENGPWEVKGFVDGVLVKDYKDVPGNTRKFAFPLYAADSNYHTLTVEVGSAANFSDGHSSDSVLVRDCVAPQGTPGPQGPQGPKGDTGDTGAQGPQGPQGPAGTPGSNGATGPKGDKGDTGATGVAGPKGDNGSVGPQGPKGDTGATGAKGDTGATGANGVAGTVGPQGPQGTSGLNGKPGKTGPRGLRGKTSFVKLIQRGSKVPNVFPFTP